MVTISGNQAYAILTGSEGAIDNTIARLAVPNIFLGQAGNGNKAGFAFGTVQLDIGNNSYAQSAYKEILNLGLSQGVVDQSQYNELLQYNNVQRPDVKYPDDYLAARELANNTVFDPDSSISPQVNAIIASAEGRYLNTVLVPDVNDFLSSHTGGVFDPGSPDYNVAVATLVSLKNRTGNLNVFEDKLSGNDNPTIEAVKRAWNSQLGNGGGDQAWLLVQRGATGLNSQYEPPFRSPLTPYQMPDEIIIANQEKSLENSLGQYQEAISTFGNAAIGIPSAQPGNGVQLLAGVGGADGSINPSLNADNSQYQQATSTFGAPSLNTFFQPVQGVQDYPYGALGGAQPSPLESSLANYQQAVSTFGTATSIDNSLQPIQSVQMPGSAEGVDSSPYGSIAQDTNAGSQSAQVAEATSSFGTPSVTTYSEPSQGVSYGGYYGGGGGYGGGSDDEEPVVLDLTGKGINITQETSSNTFFDGAGDGEQHQTAWAGAGNAVLFYDPTGTGSLTRADQVVFTDLDPSASNDMQALEDVFDTNHNGSLDAGDASYGNFYLDVTNANGTHTIESLTQAGITAINLTPNAVNQKLPDGSAIQGETTYTTSSGSTGAAATVSFAADATGYAVGSTTSAIRRNRVSGARARRRGCRNEPRRTSWRLGHRMQPENLIVPPRARPG